MTAELDLLCLCFCVSLFVVISTIPCLRASKVRFNNLQQAHEQLRVDSSTEIRKIRREAREAAKIATDKHAEAVAEAADKASALRDEVEEAEERLQEAETRHVQEVDKLKKELIKVNALFTFKGSVTEQVQGLLTISVPACCYLPIGLFSARSFARRGMLERHFCAHYFYDYVVAAFRIAVECDAECPPSKTPPYLGNHFACF